MNKLLLRIIAFCLPLVFAFNQALAQQPQIRTDSPTEHRVSRGDTLWDIAGKFLQDPLDWPEIWQLNPQIENPNLIFPGDLIRLIYVDGKPQLVLERGVASRTLKLTPTDTKNSGTTKLLPRVRVTPLETAIPAIPLDAIYSYLIQNRIVELAELEDAPYVLQGESNRIILGAGDRIYARGEWVENTPAYGIFRRGDNYIDPVTDELLGIEAVEIGSAKLLSLSSDIATMSLSEVREEVRVGDRLLTSEERRLESTYFPQAPEDSVNGLIISVLGGVSQVGQYNVVVLNKGERDGLEAGDVLAIFQTGALVSDRMRGEKVQLPAERAGLTMVFRSFEKLSYALVLQTKRPLAVGDQVRNP